MPVSFLVHVLVLCALLLVGVMSRLQDARNLLLASFLFCGQIYITRALKRPDSLIFLLFFFTEKPRNFLYAVRLELSRDAI